MPQPTALIARHMSEAILDQAAPVEALAAGAKAALSDLRHD